VLSNTIKKTSCELVIGEQMSQTQKKVFEDKYLPILFSNKIVSSTAKERINKYMRKLYDIAVNSANPIVAVKSYVKREGDILVIGEEQYDLGEYDNIYIVGAGKASKGMAKALEDILGDYLTIGQISTAYGCGKDIQLEKIGVNESHHPIPDEAGVEGADKILDLLGKTGVKDLVFYLASGGGSSIYTKPAEGITLQDMQDTTKLLLTAGATINEINCVRKHIDIVKGGQTAKVVEPSTLITLAISDVVGDKWDVISSGPTVPDPTTLEQAGEILDRYGLRDKLPGSVKNRIETPSSETPKEDDQCFNRSQNLMVATNKNALYAMAEKAREDGFDVIVDDEPVTGETRKVAGKHAGNTIESKKERSKPLLILRGGETTVKMTGTGKGGRNQEYVLAFGLEMEKLGIDNYFCMSAGTDGVDFIEEAAGAVVDGDTIKQARNKEIVPEDLLDNNDSYNFHKPMGTLISPGPTGTNVNDVIVVMVW